MRHLATRQLGFSLWIGATCALSACAAERTPATAPVQPAVRLQQCEIFACPSNFVPVPGLRSAASSVVAGGNGVWALDDQGAIYRLNERTKQFDAVPGTLAWISAGGGNFTINEDEVWGGTAHINHTFFWSSFQVWHEMDIPPAEPIRFVAAGPGHNLDECHFLEVWGLSVANHVFRLSSGNCGRYWEQIQGPSLVTIAAGGGEVWGLDATGQVFRFDATTVSFKQVTGTLTRIAVGVDGVWGILDRSPVDTGGAAIARGGGGVTLAPQVFQYDPATGTFVEIPNAPMKTIAAGGNGVWALDGSGNVFRLQAVTRKFIPVPNVTLLSLSVGSGTDVWGIDQNHQIRAFVTPTRLIRTNAPP